MTRISSGIRDAAAMLCQIAASTPEMFGNYGSIWDALGETSDAAHELAHAAWSHCWDALYADNGTRISDNTEALGALEAEAEALLRSGWKP